MPESSVAKPDPDVPAKSSSKSDRLTSIDLARGVVMALMALDHVRDYFSSTPLTMDPAQTTAALFFTRWISHFCAPAFFLLAGVGAYLSLSRRKNLPQYSRHLVARGAFLVLLDLVVVRIGWDFNFAFDGGPWFIVLSTLGFSMMILAALIHLPYPAIAFSSIVIIGGHNLFDWVDNENLQAWEPLWTFLHMKQGTSVAGLPVYVTYPLIPWVAVMSLGYCLGPIFCLDGPRRRSRLCLLGLAMTLTFLALRASNAYGDPQAWSSDYEGLASALAFLGTEKYPPSLLFLLMTLGPLLMLLAGLEYAKGRLADWLIAFGRAPLFFYILHFYVIHALVLLAGVCAGYDAPSLCVYYSELPAGFGFPLPGVYVATLVVLILCYPACVWFDDLKRRNKSAWLSYI